MKIEKKRWLQRIFILIGCLCILGALTLTIAYGITIGNIIAFAIGSGLIILVLFFRKFPLWMQRTITVLIISGATFFIIITSIIISAGIGTDVTYIENCVIVFGSGIRGEKLLPTLQSRLDKCVEYVSRNPGIMIIVSGGQGRNEDIPEAEAMKRYLLQKGIPQSQIIKEDQSRNTIQNLGNSQELLNEYFRNNTYTVVCITSDYHVYRTRQTAKKMGYDARFYPAGVKWYLRPSAYFREVLSVCKYWIFG